jgi:hypothetical protein
VDDPSQTVFDPQTEGVGIGPAANFDALSSVAAARMIRDICDDNIVTVDPIIGCVPDHSDRQEVYREISTYLLVTVP